MSQATRLDSSRFSDVLQLLRDVEKTYAVKVRISVVPRPRTGYSEGCIVLATPYHANGRKMDAVTAEQHLWPTKSHKTREGLEMYLIYQLIERLDEWQAQAARQAQMGSPEDLSPLEQYIARQF